MKILGMDLATVSGWSLLEDDKIIEFGAIQCSSSSLSTIMKMNFYYNEFCRLIERLKPDYCVIEDPILAISGVKVLIYLARINSCGLLAAMKYINHSNIELYTPPQWKKECNLGLSGSSKKWEIQWQVCNKFNFIDSNSDEFKNWKNIITEQEDIQKQIKNQIEFIQSKISSFSQALNRKKRNVLEGEEKLQAETDLKNCTKLLQENRKQEKVIKKEKDKKLQKLSDDIYYRTGISTDIADSVGLALCLKKLKKL